MWYLAVGLAARGWESHNLEIWWNSDSFFVSFEVTLSGSRVPGYTNLTQYAEWWLWYCKNPQQAGDFATSHAGNVWISEPYLIMLEKIKCHYHKLS